MGRFGGRHEFVRNMEYTHKVSKQKNKGTSEVHVDVDVKAPGGSEDMENRKKLLQKRRT